MASQRGGGIILRSRREVELMRSAGGLVRRVLDRVAELTAPGVTTGHLNEVAEKMIADAGATPLFKGVKTSAAKFPFPGVLCTSVNDEVVHGIPSDRALVDGDVVSVDCGVRLDGYCGDSARTFPVGRIEGRVQELLDVTRRSLEIAIENVQVGRMWSEVAGEIQRYVEGFGFTLVREFVGHGIGQDLWEEPKVPNYVDRKSKRSDFRLVEGLVIAIEPMVNMGRAAVEYAGPERWAVSTKDGKPSAHFEHTIAVTADGADILTIGEAKATETGVGAK